MFVGVVDVVNVYANESAFAALREDGSVVTWGEIETGGDSYSAAVQLSGQTKVVDIYANLYSFAALREDGSVITWGDFDFGGDSSNVKNAIDGTINVKNIYATERAFAALRSDGSVISWGEVDDRLVSKELNGAFDVVAIYTNSIAGCQPRPRQFIARRLHHGGTETGRRGCVKAHPLLYRILTVSRLFR